MTEFLFFDLFNVLIINVSFPSIIPTLSYDKPTRKDTSFVK